MPQAEAVAELVSGDAQRDFAVEPRLGRGSADKRRAAEAAHIVGKGVDPALIVHRHPARCLGRLLRLRRQRAGVAHRRRKGDRQPAGHVACQPRRAIRVLSDKRAHRAEDGLIDLVARPRLRRVVRKVH